MKREGKVPGPDEVATIMRDVAADYDAKSDAYHATSELWDDGILDPLRTRDAPLIGLVPGAAHATKRWPVRHWRRLASALARRGYNLAVVGSSGDRILAAEIATSAGRRAASAAGDLDLQTSGALLRRARAVVSGDTGPMHLATAVGTAVEAFGFFPYKAEAAVLEKPLPCRPCSSKGSPHCPLGHHRCMEEIMPEDVLSRLTSFGL